MYEDTLVIMGQGYVGLPIAMQALEAGFRVVGFDTDQSRVNGLLEGKSYVGDIDDVSLTAGLHSHRYFPTCDLADLAGFSYAIIAVPTPLREGAPDLSYIEEAAEALSLHTTQGSTIVLESTTYPGTTEKIVVPILERGSGLKAGIDFHVGYSPERIDPGNVAYTFATTPKIVSGIDEPSLVAVEELYSRLVRKVIPVKSTQVAELTKLLENTFRHVNIALVNELAIFAHSLGIDVWEAIDAASTKPFGFMRFTPGPGVGGHCLPIDPSYLSWEVKRSLGQNFRFVELANDVNDHMPDYVVGRIAEGLNVRCKSVKGSRVLLFGLAYKSNTSDARESPAVKVAELLLALGADVLVVDSHVRPSQVPTGVTLVEADPEVIYAADAVVILTDHDDVDYAQLTQAPGFVLDTRRRLNGLRDSL